MEIGLNWTCPYCNRDQTVHRDNRSSSSDRIYIAKLAEGKAWLTGHFIGCANVKCRRLTANVAIRPGKENSRGAFEADYDAEPILFRRLLPEGRAKPQPDYIPKPIVEDYAEACLVVDLSPKAAATLIRRCLQGMIRDFAGISGKTLFAEIDQLRRSVESGEAPQGITDETIDAIDHVRKVGNIGAHMESNINHIVEVDAGEAEALISLVEMLFEEWYVARQKRQEKFARIAAIAVQKDEAKKAGEATPPQN